MGNCFCVKKEVASNENFSSDFENEKYLNDEELINDSNEYLSSVDFSKQILYKMANKVIDVSGYDFPSLDVKELEERRKIYSNKLNELRLPVIKEKPRISKLIDVKNLIIKGRINDDDCFLINDATKKSLKAVNDNFKIKNDQELVVTFET